jgi:hypothetical protein
MRIVALVAAILSSGTLFTSIFVSTALAVTTVQTTSENSVGQDGIAVEKHKSSATQPIDPAGFGLHEGCCSNVDTTFTPYLKLDDKIDNKNKGWSSEPIKSLDKPAYVSGIKLTSKPADKKDGKEPNFTKFNFVPFLNIGGSSYDNSSGHDDDDDCDEEERKIHHKGHKRHHHHKDHGDHHCYGPDCPDQGPPLTPTPLPAALPLMGSVLGGFGIVMWRRRRKQKAA